MGGAVSARLSQDAVAAQAARWAEGSIVPLAFFIFSPSLSPHSSPLTQRTQWRRKKRRENRGVRRERERQVDYPFLEEPRAEEWEGQKQAHFPLCRIFLCLHLLLSVCVSCRSVWPDLSRVDLSGQAEAMGLASRATGRGVTSAGALASLFRVALLFFGIWDVQTQTVNTKPTYIWQTGMAVLSKHKSMLKMFNIG